MPGSMSLPRKRTEHKRTPGDIEITRFELMRIFDGDEDWLHTLEHNFFCGTCHPGSEAGAGSPNRRLINYRVMVNDLFDIALQGTCSGCNTIAARYVETGKDPAKVKRIKSVLRERKKGHG